MMKRIISDEDGLGLGGFGVASEQGVAVIAPGQLVLMGGPERARRYSDE